MKELIAVFKPILNKTLYLFLIGTLFLSSCRSQNLTLTDSGNASVVADREFFYLKSTKKPANLFLYSISTGISTQLTASGLHIFDYDLPPDGTGVLYSAVNENDGGDIWYLDFETQNSKLVVDCGSETCSSPRFSPTGEIFSYLRGSFPSEAPNFEKDTRIELFNLTQAQNINFGSGEIIFGSNVLWSRDGKNLVYYSFESPGIRIIDLQGNEILTVSGTTIANAYAWGRDSDYFYFLIDEINADLPLTIIEQVFLPQKQFQRLAVDFARNEVINGLKISVQSGLFLFSVRTSALSPGQKMVVYDLEKQKVIAQTDDPSASYGNISWSADGKTVLFQRYAFNQTAASPEIGIWNYEGDEPEIYVSDAFMPKWLP